MKSFSILFIAVVVVVVALTGESAEAVTCNPVTCNPMKLNPCLGAISSPTVTPTKECCTNLIKQKSCLCCYMKNPAYKHYVDSPNARRVSVICGIFSPMCLLG
ncbi:non-specific lipid-transfer protein 2-like [Impatiens glandulifera]|uniref:non-specific lipid-transfer protein 2-like n=1 Tax=Impatiens glandulifera TaxID=253017 RepID=UPI001FB17EF4|nr:non-specific lipid-transfer protein 2-like [Impatiens glandulifera]